jgi:hypothetical protein
MTKKTKKVAVGSNAMSYEERFENAVHADEINALFDEQEPGLVTVLKKFRVTPMLYVLVAGQIDSITRNLIDGIEYSPADLIGDEYWSQFDKEGQREMALCVKHFAVNSRSTLTDTETGTFMLAD